ncbi:hypothetical protein F4809DRAFT_647053 [Biscogniauxia mediterranea]|nr:hypothetical protein F4809DRAFT_647053 [Biscogniauxia mediterranea]
MSNDFKPANESCNGTSFNTSIASGTPTAPPASAAAPMTAGRPSVLGVSMLALMVGYFCTMG